MSMIHSAGWSRLMVGWAIVFQMDQSEVIIIGGARGASGRDSAWLLNITPKADLDGLSGPEWLLSASQLWVRIADSIIAAPNHA
jgi:hypothetical protein